MSLSQKWISPEAEESQRKINPVIYLFGTYILLPFAYEKKMEVRHRVEPD